MVRVWTPEEVRLLLWWVSQGVKQVVIARRLGRTPPAVKKKLWHLRGEPKMPPRRSRASVSSSVGQLWRRGFNDVEIGERTGLSPQAVLRTRRRLGLPANCDHAGAARISHEWRRRYKAAGEVFGHAKPAD